MAMLVASSPPLAQRRHRKMLKDGSSEVWPQDAEDVFLDGLRQYWNSPWANFSRGRSRWRNQYLVDYLKSHAIERSKKQVASHIQVLRNMLKGTPDFCLVAGPDEVSSTDDLSPVRGSPQRRGSVSSSASSPRATGIPPAHQVKAELSPALQTHFEQPLAYQPQQQQPQQQPPQIQPQPPLPLDLLTTPIRVSGLCLWTGGMQPNYIDIDALPADSSPENALAPAPPLAPHTRVRASLRLRLTMPPSIDPSSSSASSSSSVTSASDSADVRGFNGAITFSQPLPPTAKCLTKVHVSSQCISQENAPLVPITDPTFQPHLFSSIAPQPSPASNAMRYPAFLPDSWLSRCRWLDTGKQKTLVTQQVMVDSDVLFVVIYDVQRVKHTQPSAELVLFHKHYDAAPPPQRPLSHPNSHPHPHLAPQVHVPISAPSTSHFVNAFTPYDAAPHALHHQPRHSAPFQQQHVHQDFLMPVSPTSPIASPQLSQSQAHSNANAHANGLPMSPMGMRSCASSTASPGQLAGANTDPWANLLTLM